MLISTTRLKQKGAPARQLRVKRVRFFTAKTFISLFHFTSIMSLVKKKWWRRLVKAESEPKIDVSKDITATLEFLEDSTKLPKFLIIEFKKLEELEKESHIAKSGLLQVNLQAQAKILDKIIDAYESLQNDTDINGIRVKRVVAEFLRRAQRAGLKDLVEKKKEDGKWHCQW